VIYISDFVGRMLVRTPRNRLIFRPIEASLTRPLTKDLGDLVTIGIVGRIDPEKSIELVISAVAQTSRAILHIYGDGFSAGLPYIRKIQALGETELGSRIVFKGRQAPEMIYSALDILVVGNSREASGRTVGEAQAAGVAVVVPSKGGAMEYVVDGISGLVYEADNQNALAEALKSLIEDANLRRALAVAGQRKVTLERSVGSVARAYAAAVDGGGAS
jgi:glycosyltransferase involved in cell wall biosynthesis